MKMKHAKIIADSITQRGHRLTTLEVIIPNIVVPEMLKHRMFSISSMSMRAVPFEKMVKWVEENPFIPYAWQKSHKGMQGTEYITNETKIDNLENDWDWAMKNAIDSAKRLYEQGVSKQICNRLLFPFGYTKMIITATEWENFFQQRCPKYFYSEDNVEKYCNSWNDYIKVGERLGADQEVMNEVYNTSLVDRQYVNKSTAEIHMQAVAEDIWDAMQESEPTLLKEGEWHVPYSDKISKVWTDYGREISIAKCARQSFDSEWSDDYSKDLELYKRLKRDKHWVPFEHVSQVMYEQQYLSCFKGQIEVIYHEETDSDIITYAPEETYGWADNFRGFMSVRFKIKNGLIG